MDDVAGRSARIGHFLARAGWGESVRRPLAGDASFRRYERLEGAAGRAVLMDAPPPREGVAAFRALARLLLDMGFSAPRIYAADEDAGLLLLEDFGDRLFAAELAEGRDPQPLYALATDTLVALHGQWRRRAEGAREAPGLPDYDDGLLVDGEAGLLLDWYMPAIGIVPSAEDRADYGAAWRAALEYAHALPRTLVLRDYFPDNLVLLPGRQGTRACGLLDFQDAARGCCAYDLASLLQDARRDVPADIEDAMIARYLDAFPALDETRFRAGYAAIAAQRHAKVVGIFTRLAHRDGKPGYLRHIPRVWRLLERCLEDPALRPVKQWFDARLPTEVRMIPPKETPQ